MGLLIQFVCFLCMLMSGIDLIQGYSSQKNDIMEIVEEIVEDKLKHFTKELESVKKNLKEEQRKSYYLEKKLNALINGDKRIYVDIKGKNYLYNTEMTMLYFDHCLVAPDKV